MTMMRAISNAVERAREALGQMLQRGIIRTVAADGFCQVEAFELDGHDLVELWQQWGFSSRPINGTEAIVLLIDADGDKPIAIVTHSRDHRPEALGIGDSALWGKKDSNGLQAMVHAKAGGDTDVLAGTSGFATLGANSAAAEFAIKGETFNTYHSNLLSSFASAFSALASDPVLLPSTTSACTGAASAITTFEGLRSAFKTVKGKVF